MKIETKTGIVILHVSDIMASHRLDPIRITLEDIEPGKGRINVECYGKAWASYWGGTGSQTIAQFFAGCDNGYLIEKLSPSTDASRYSAEAMQGLAQRTVCLRRRWRDVDTICEFDRLDEAEARELFDEAESLRFCETPNDCWGQSGLLTRIFGTEWFHWCAGKATEPNPEYVYLSRICDAVRGALREHAKTAAAEVAA